MKFVIVAGYFQRDQKEIASKFLLKLCPQFDEVKILSSIVCTGRKAGRNLGTLIFSYLTVA